VKQLKKLADEVGITLTNLSLCWCLKNPNVSSVILGASKEAQLAENLKAFDSMDKLNGIVMQKIEDILQNKPVIPQY
jgi:aryl-alcohol dehydrogenase-like predicted oxidoreductase